VGGHLVVPGGPCGGPGNSLGGPWGSAGGKLGVPGNGGGALGDPWGIPGGYMSIASRRLLATIGAILFKHYCMSADQQKRGNFQNQSLARAGDDIYIYI
jgi:hypothetical protein